MTEKKQLKEEELEKVSGGITIRDGFQIYQNYNLLLLNTGDYVTLFKYNNEIHRFESKGNVQLTAIINNNNVFDVEFTYEGSLFHLNVAASAVDYGWAIGPANQ